MGLTAQLEQTDVGYTLEVKHRGRPLPVGTDGGVRLQTDSLELALAVLREVLLHTPDEQPTQPLLLTALEATLTAEVREPPPASALEIG